MRNNRYLTWIMAVLLWLSILSVHGTDALADASKASGAPAAPSGPSTSAPAVPSAPQTQAERQQLRDTLKHIQAHYKSTNSFGGKFTEQIFAVGGGKRDRSGKVYYEKPGKMRWEFDQPHPQTIVSDGTNLYSYEPDLNQALKTPVKRAFKSAAPVAFLLGIGDLERDFKAFLPPPAKDNLLHISLVPKSGGDVVELGMDPKTYNLASVRVTDQLGNTTVLAFSDVHENVALDQSMFRFEPPKGTDVVEAPGEPKGEPRNGDSHKGPAAAASARAGTSARE
jgi:outer membrane lipoprotein carrier protein